MKVESMTPWHVIVDDMTRSGLPRTPDLVRFAYNAGHGNGLVWQALASIFMVCDYTQSILNQKYAVTFYKSTKQWLALIACAQDALFFPKLRVMALGSLLEAAVHLEHSAYITSYTHLACSYHEQGLVMTPQFIEIFFGALMPYYHRNMHSESILAARRILRLYSPELSDLLYAHLQAKLHAYSTAIAKELAGQRDPLLSC